MRLQHHLVLVLGIFAMLWRGTFCEMTSKLQVKGTPPTPSIANRASLISNSSVLFLAFLHESRITSSEKGNHSLGTLIPLLSPCPSNEPLSPFSFYFVADQKNNSSDELWHFSFKKGNYYIIFLQKTQQKGIFRPLGALESSEHEFRDLYGEFCKYFKGCWEAGLTLQSPALWYRDVQPTSTTYHLAPRATFQLTCRAHRVPQYYYSKHFRGYNLTIITSDGRRVNKVNFLVK
ncbi:uncharacterized protein [Cherax quadricarinatus]|uniref:uncharacterized protein n=1 Tax=Cherax quadricarinatus TaxID=27406 RepID=UPI00387E70E3